MSRPQNKFVAVHGMSSQHLKLYTRIQAFEIDEPNVVFPFSQRLARENHWSLTYTQRVIVEYKKFLFLTIAADCSIVPSDAVDQVWHLHLTYTQSYWDELCAHILQKPLHHRPTRGGASQTDLFLGCYRDTLDRYEAFFGSHPPSDIWQPPTVRFQQPGQFKRVSSQGYWLLPKPSLRIPKFASFQSPHRSWLRFLSGALFAFGLILSLHFLYHPAIAACVDFINFLINQPAFAEASSQAGHSPASPAVSESAPVPVWNMWVGSFILLSLFITVLLVADSRCSKCGRFGVVQTTVRTLRERTEESDGERLVTRVCQHCDHTEQRHQLIPKGSDSDVGCAGCV